MFGTAIIDFTPDVYGKLQLNTILYTDFKTNIRDHIVEVQSGMAAIPKSTNPTRIRENLDIYDFELAPAELQFIDSFNCGVRAYPLLEVQHDVNYPFHIE